MGTLMKKHGSGFDEIRSRETGVSSPLSFWRRISASEGIVRKVSLYGRLHGHEGCVNAIEFSSSGNVLVSGSDDTDVRFWDWASKKKLLSYPSGHMDNIFQTKILPFTDDKRVVTSAGDGQVRLGVLNENGEVYTAMLGQHDGNVYKLAVEPGCPHTVYSGGEDGLVLRFDLRSNSSMKLFTCSSSKKDSGKCYPLRLRSTVINPRNPNHIAVGGSDEYARVYDTRMHQCGVFSSRADTAVEMFCPHHLVGTDEAYITGLAYSNSSELLVSYNDELIYLFQKEMGMRAIPQNTDTDDEKLGGPQVYAGHRNARTVKGVNFLGPNDEYVCSGSDCGHIFIWKKKGAVLFRVMAGDRYIVNHVESHPSIPVFASCGIEKTVKLWGPVPESVVPIPSNTEQVMMRNKEGRERMKMMVMPDVIMRALGIEGGQTMEFLGRRSGMNSTDSDSEDGGDGYVLSYTDWSVPSEDGGVDQPSECNPG